MKFVESVPFLICSLLAAAGAVVIANSLVPAPAVLAASSLAQDASKDAAAPADLSGSWQMSWTSQDGTPRQASMQIKQDGSKLSGSIDGQRGTAPLSGKPDGDQVSLSMKLRRRHVSFSGTVAGDKISGATAGGGSWTATRQQQQ